MGAQSAAEKASGLRPEALSTTPKWFNMYGEFITKNASAVSQIESGLRSLTYIIPGRFRESEIASESLHSGVQLLSLYHDSLLARAAAALPSAQKSIPSPHNRYTRFWTTKSPLYRRVALLLQMTQYTELLWEMAARRKGEKTRWRIVVLLECLKAICRLFLLRLTNSRPLLSPPLPERDVDPSKLEESASHASSTDGSTDPTSDRRSSSSSSSATDSAWSMPRTGLTLPTLPATPDISTYLLSRVLTADDIKPPKQLLHRINTSVGTLAEVLYILRPVIYALAMQRWAYGQDKKANWRPWLLGLSIEWGARQLAKRDLQTRVAGGWRGLTGLEKEELKRRGWQMGWWAMRGAFYENVTKHWIHSVTSSLNSKPLLNLVGGVIEDYEFLWDQYYFPTATL